MRRYRSKSDARRLTEKRFANGALGSIERVKPSLDCFPANPLAQPKPRLGQAVGDRRARALQP
jgi:hypothetical protein